MVLELVELFSVFGLAEAELQSLELAFEQARILELRLLVSVEVEARGKCFDAYLPSLWVQR